MTAAQKELVRPHVPNHGFGRVRQQTSKSVESTSLFIGLRRLMP